MTLIETFSDDYYTVEVFRNGPKVCTVVQTARRNGRTEKKQVRGIDCLLHAKLDAQQRLQRMADARADANEIKHKTVK